MFLFNNPVIDLETHTISTVDTVADTLVKLKSTRLSTTLNLRAHNITKFFQICWCKVVIVSVTAMHIFVNAVNIEGNTVKKFRLEDHSQFG